MDAIRELVARDSEFAAVLPKWEETLVNPDSVVSFEREIITELRCSAKQEDRAETSTTPNTAEGMDTGESNERDRRTRARENRALRIEMGVLGMQTAIEKKRLRLAAMKTLIDKQRTFLQDAKIRYEDGMEKLKALRKELSTAKQRIEERQRLAEDLKSLEQFRHVPSEAIKKDLDSARTKLAERQLGLVEARSNVITALRCLEKARGAIEVYHVVPRGRSENRDEDKERDKDKERERGGERDRGGDRGRKGPEWDNFHTRDKNLTM